MAYSYGVTDGKIALTAVAREPFGTDVDQQIQAMAIEQQAANGGRAVAEFRSYQVAGLAALARGLAAESSSGLE